MRYEKGSFITVANREKIMGCDPHIQTVYLWLSYHANQDGNCFPSYETLVKETGVSRRKIIYAISQLEKMGIVKKEESWIGKKQSSNIYTILIVGSDSQSPVGVHTVHPGGAYGAPGGVHTVHPGGAYGAPGGVHTVHPNYIHTVELKNRTKDIHTEVEVIDFEEFWKVYPKKVGKGKSKELWKKLSLADQKAILEDIPKRRGDAKWIGGFVKDPERYIKHRQWEDEIIQPRAVDARTVDRFV